MSKETFILHEWEKEKMDALKELAHLEDAKTDGFDLGHAEGRAEGRAEGFEQGTKESKLEIAKNLLKNNISIDIISNSTGLSIEEIKNIK